MPYFDHIIEKLDNDDPLFSDVFSSHVHFGYWQHHEQATGTIADFKAATENLSHLVIEQSGIRDGMTILDVGCGIGGTIALLNKLYSNLTIIGLNIDFRQLSLARRAIKPINNNAIYFIQGDACQLPFKDLKIDAVLAIECIFHFHDRQDFFKESARILMTDGNLCLTDITLERPDISCYSISNMAKKFTSLFYGNSNNWGEKHYLEIEHQFPLVLLHQQDITDNILPTFQFYLDNLKVSWTANLATRLVQAQHRSRGCRYQVYTFKKQKTHS